MDFWKRFTATCLTLATFVSLSLVSCVKGDGKKPLLAENNLRTLMAFAATGLSIDTTVGSRSDVSVFGVFSDGSTQNVTAEISVECTGEGIKCTNESGVIRLDALATGTFEIKAKHPKLNETMTISLRVTDAKLNYLLSSTQSLKIVQGLEGSFSLSGVFSDGVRREIRSECELSYDRSKLTITPSPGSSNLEYKVKADAVGIGDIVATCSGQSISIAYEVSSPKFVSIHFSDNANPLYVPHGTSRSVMILGTLENGQVVNITTQARITQVNETDSPLTISTQFDSLRNEYVMQITANRSSGQYQRIIATFYNLAAELRVEAGTAALKQLELTGLPSEFFTGEPIAFSIRETYSDGTSRFGSPAEYAGKFTVTDNACSLSYFPLSTTCLKAGNVTLAVSRMNSLSEQISTSQTVLVVLDEPVSIQFSELPGEMPLNHQARMIYVVRHKSGRNSFPSVSRSLESCHATDTPDASGPPSAKLDFKVYYQNGLATRATQVGTAYIHCTFNYWNHVFGGGERVSLTNSTKVDVIPATLEDIAVTISGNNPTPRVYDTIGVALTGVYSNGAQLPLVGCLRLATNGIPGTPFSSSPCSDYERMQIRPIDLSYIHLLKLHVMHESITKVVDVPISLAFVTNSVLALCPSGYANGLYPNLKVGFCLAVAGYIPLKDSELDFLDTAVIRHADDRFSFKTVPVRVRLKAAYRDMPTLPPTLQISTMERYNYVGTYGNFADSFDRLYCAATQPSTMSRCLCGMYRLGNSLPATIGSGQGSTRMGRLIDGELYPMLIAPYPPHVGLVSALIEPLPYEAICYSNAAP